MHLALEVGVSTRHLSFVETGRAKPSVEMLIALAHGLDVPLRQRNSLLRYPNIETLSRPIPVTTENDPELLIPWKLRLNGVSRSYFITLTKFATPQDITLDELTLELFYPVESGEQEGSRYKGPKAT